ncbi:MAG: dihydromethanopterin reductase (acceptor) [Thermoprotei archaeon]|nr:MAG: dihydromethanopterin reductase (acceptor) [Thermoprotei archaeon]
MKLMWGITGAGYLLEESFNEVEEVKERFSAKVTTVLTRAGEEVVRVYGLEERLKRISPGGYYEELLTELSEGACGYRAGRLAVKAYDLLFVSPASANTVAKIVHGIADTPVTNAVAQALKGGVPVVVVPTDQAPYVEAPSPHRVDRDLCVGCQPCRAAEACPHGAVKLVEGKAWIDLALCHGCSLCSSTCPYGAIKVGEKVRVKVRSLDLANVDRLRSMEGVRVLSSPSELLAVVKELLGL